jgi:predicted RNA-binding protein with PIN domain
VDRPDAVLVDGYNLLHAIPRFAPRGAELEPARAELERWLADAAPRHGVHEVILVWDGRERGGSIAGARGRLRILFTERGVTADERLLGLCRGAFADRAARTWVVSSDRDVQAPARELGFGAIGAMTFFRRWSDARPRGACGREAERAGGREAEPKPAPTRRDVDELFEQFLNENTHPLSEDEP